MTPILGPSHAVRWGTTTLARVSVDRTRGVANAAPSSPSSLPSTTPATTHFKITLRRSAISLGDRKKGTLKSLGLHRRMQTVYHRHSPDIAGKVLFVKELVEVENVNEGRVKTKQQQRDERKGERGYKVVGEKRLVAW